MVQEIEEHTSECFNIIERMQRWNNCLKRKRVFIKKLLKVAERSREIDHTCKYFYIFITLFLNPIFFLDILSVKQSLERNQKIQLMCRNYSSKKWRPFEGTRPRGFKKRNNNRRR